MVPRTAMLGELDVQIRDTRRRLEERRHLRNCLKEAVNDIRRYRRRLKELEGERRGLATRAPAAGDERRAVTIAAHVAEAVLEGLLLARDGLREAVERDVDVEAKWSRLVTEREHRLAALPAPLRARLGELEEDRGKLIGQIRVAQHVRQAAQRVLGAGTVLERLLAEEADLEDLVVALITAQKAILDLRRQTRHMGLEARQYEADLDRILGFGDRFAEALADEHGRPGSPGRCLRALGELEALAGDLRQRADRFLDGRRRASRELAPAPGLPVYA